MNTDFTDKEITTIRELLTHHYLKDVELHLADSEIQLESSDTETVNCPAVFWHVSKSNFVVLKTSESNYKARFFYTPHEQYETEVDQFTNLEQCIAAVLQHHGDHERDKQGAADHSATLNNEIS